MLPRGRLVPAGGAFPTSQQAFAKKLLILFHLSTLLTESVELERRPSLARMSSRLKARCPSRGSA